MQGRDRGNFPEKVSFISTQLSGRYAVINAFTLVRGSTSGYSGSGPQVHDEIYELIKDNEDEIAIGRFLITSREHE